MYPLDLAFASLRSRFRLLLLVNMLLGTLGWCRWRHLLRRAPLVVVFSSGRLKYSLADDRLWSCGRNCRDLWEYHCRWYSALPLLKGIVNNIPGAWRMGFPFSVFVWLVLVDVLVVCSVVCRWVVQLLGTVAAVFLWTALCIWCGVQLLWWQVQNCQHYCSVCRKGWDCPVLCFTGLLVDVLIEVVCKEIGS